jgi:predicted GNAT family acetyltransferase
VSVFFCSLSVRLAFLVFFFKNKAMEYIVTKNMVYLINEDKKRIAYVTYPFMKEGVVDIQHTFVDESLRGQGIAGKLMEKAVDELRKDGRKAHLTCPYAKSYFEKHPEAQDVLESK